MTEKEKFKIWQEQAIKDGLEDIKVTTQNSLDNFARILGIEVPEREPVTEEEIYSDLNAMINAPTVPHFEEVFESPNPVFTNRPDINDIINAPGIPHPEGLFPPESIGPDNVARF